MPRILSILFILLPCIAIAQTGEMRAYTVAGSDTAMYVTDGVPATSSKLNQTEGIWMDGNCALYISSVLSN